MLPSSAVTTTSTLLVPTLRACAPIPAREAPASLAVAVTVTEVTELATEREYAKVPAVKSGIMVCPVRAKAEREASVAGGSALVIVRT